MTRHHHVWAEAAVWVLSLAAAALSAAYLTSPHPDPSRAPRLDVVCDILTSAIAVAGIVVAAWVILTAALARLTLHRQRRGRSTRALRVLLRYGAPIVRRAIMGAASLSLSAAATTGLALAGTSAPTAPLGADIGWGATAYTQTLTPTSPPAHDGGEEDASEAIHVVAPGESLWSISRDRLGADADAAAIDRAWHLVWHSNRDVVGPNPHLIVPGTVLTIPAF